MKRTATVSAKMFILQACAGMQYILIKYCFYDKLLNVTFVML